LVRLSELATPDIRFVDPFNDVTGIAPLRASSRSCSSI
jgi:hypothetical protein